MQKEQLKGYFDSVTVQEKLPRTSLFIDFDLYAEEPKLHVKGFKKGLAEFLKLGETEVQQRSIAFVDQFGGFQR